MIMDNADNYMTAFLRNFCNWLVLKSDFLNQGRNSVVNCFDCCLWSFRPFGVAELVSAFPAFNYVSL